LKGLKEAKVVVSLFGSRCFSQLSSSTLRCYTFRDAFYF